MGVYKINLKKNEKQRSYLISVLGACKGLNEFRYFAYGGAIRGGKSYITAFILLTLAKKYPGTRWHVVRQDMPVLESTTIPTFQKLIGASAEWSWIRDKANYHLLHTNGSKIFFKGENLVRDPLLNDFLGLETNGIWMEQAEELSEKMWEKALERTGSWVVHNMPPGFIFLTFNPTQNWVKQKFYQPWAKGMMNEPFMYIPALPKDNPFVTKSQWQQWDRMAKPYHQQFIEGSWDDFADKSNLWAFAYNPVLHSRLPTFNPRERIYLSFDFNVNPMCCSVIQMYNNCIGVLEVIKLPNSNTFEMCDYIRSTKYMRCELKVTGDACGRHRDASQTEAMHNYAIIERKLGVGPFNFNVPSVNPPLQINKVLVNSILQKFPVFIDPVHAKALHYDLANTRCNPDGSIIKGNRNDPSQQCDALDTFRYWCNTYMDWFLKMI